MTRQAPLFLARKGYRLRRLSEAARLLPLAGLFFVLLPVLWGGGSTRGGVVFVFSVWIALVLGAFLLARPLAGAQGDRAPGSREGGDGPL